MARKNARLEDPSVGRRSPYANQAEVDAADAAILETPDGRSDEADPEDAPTLFDDEAVDVEAQPQSEVTGGPEFGTSDETADGLDETEEAVRHMAEDVPTGGRP